MNKILFTFSLQLQLQLTVDSVTHMYVGTVHVGIVDVHMVQLLYILHVCTTSTRGTHQDLAK